MCTYIYIYIWDLGNKQLMWNREPNWMDWVVNIQSKMVGKSMVSRSENDHNNGELQNIYAAIYRRQHISHWITIHIEL